MNIENTEKKSHPLLTCFILVTIILPPLAVHASTTIKNSAGVNARFNTLHIPFIKNEGQVDPEVSYYAKTSGATLFVTRKGEMVYSLFRRGDKGLTGISIREILKGAFKIQPYSGEKSVSRVNYFKGADPEKWRTNLSTFDRVMFGEIYRGIELSQRLWQPGGEGISYQAGGRPGPNPDAGRWN